MLREHSAIPSPCIKLPFVIKIFVLSIFEWPLYTGFTVCHLYACLLYAVFSKINFFKKIFQMPSDCQTILIQIRPLLFAWPDLDPNCLQRQAAKAVTSRQRDTAKPV